MSCRRANLFYNKGKFKFALFTHKDVSVMFCFRKRGLINTISTLWLCTEDSLSLYLSFLRGAYVNISFLTPPYVHTQGKISVQTFFFCIHKFKTWYFGKLDQFLLKYNLIDQKYWCGKDPLKGYACVSNSQGRNLGRLVTSARTSCLSIIQGNLGESGKGIFTIQSN